MSRDIPLPSIIDRDLSVCIACGGHDLRHRFSLRVLGEHQAEYDECAACGTLQVSRVTWLGDSYGRTRGDLDTGAAQRSILCSLFIRAMARTKVVSPRAKVLDFGAGSGLLVRLLRDQGFDARGYDRYTETALCRDFRVVDTELENVRADLLTAFEVFEHLVDPLDTLRQLTSRLAPGGMVLLRTCLYDTTRHDENWPYLSPEHGQHINFFSSEGLRRLAQCVGMKVHFLPFGFHLLSAPDKRLGPFRRLRLLLTVSRYVVMARLLGLVQFKYAQSDNLLVAEKHRGRNDS